MTGERTVLIAPDSFKGSLTSVQVARALADGWLRGAARRRDPASARWPTAARARSPRSRRPAAGRGDLARPRSARPHDQRAVAGVRTTASARSSRWPQASGLSLVAADERDPIRATSIGTGELVAAAIDAGVAPHHARHRRQRHDGRRRGLCARGLRSGRPLDSPASIRGCHVELEVACDVSNPLWGRPGPPRSTARRRARRPSDVDALDARNARGPTSSRRANGRRERDTPGRRRRRRRRVRAARDPGPLPAFALRPGVALVMEATDFDAAPCAGRPRHHRRRPDRRPDGLRQDRARRGATGSGRPACGASPSVAASRPRDRGARGGRRPGRPGRGGAAVGRGGDGRRLGAPGPLWRADRHARERCLRAACRSPG